MPDDPLVALALRLTDGESIDWKAESQSGSVDLSLLQILKQIEAVARAHESGDTPNPGDIAPSGGGPFWGHLEIIELIGSGSYGDVYRARDTRLGRDVALKLLRTRDATKSGSTSPVKEGHLLSRVRHANVVTVYGADCLNGQTGLWMELIEGETLEQEVRRRGVFQADEVAQIGAVLCDALEAVHSAGLLHRDVKAQNVMRDRAGRLVLMDFGSGYDAQRFAGCTVEGTPLYAAPEVLNGAQASVRSDIYSLGVLLWYLLTARYPVNGRSVTEIRRAHALRRIANLEEAAAAGAVARIAAECLAIDPRKRTPTVGELRKRLRECGQPPGWRRRSIRNASALGAFAAAVLLLATVPLHVSSKAEAASVGPIWSRYGGATLSGAPSADGHYFACSSRDAPVAVCNVTTGIVQGVPVTRQETDWPNSSPKVSPDGQRIAYEWIGSHGAKVFDLSTAVSKSLRVPHAELVRIVGWRDSGDSLLVVYAGVRWTVALLEVANETVTELKQFETNPEGVALSHDGRYLAFTQGDNLYIANLVSGETRLSAVVESGIRKELLWMPKDDGLLFIAGIRFIWGKFAAELRLMRLIEGMRVGEIEVVPTYDHPFLLLGIAGTGDVYYYAFPKQPMTLYIAPFNAATQQLGSPTAVVDLPYTTTMDWSPDSQSIVYASWNPAKSEPTIVIRNVRTSVERRIDLSIVGGITCLRWSREAGILTGTSQLYLVSLDDMSVKPLPIGARWGVAEWAPDGWTALVAGMGDVREVDVATGTVSEIHKVPADNISLLSPTENLVAFSNEVNGMSEVQLAGLDESMSRTLLSSGQRSCRPVGWWKRQVFVACQHDSDLQESSSLYLVDVDSGTIRGFDVNLPRIKMIRARPDGQAIAIATGITEFGRVFTLKVPSR